MLLFVFNIFFIAFFFYFGYSYPPFNSLPILTNGLLGGGFAAALSLIAIKIKKSELKSIWSASVGLFGGMLMGWLVYFMFYNVTQISFSGFIFFKTFFLLGIPISGLFIGIHKPNMFSPLNIKEFLRGSSAFTESFLLDTSAIIDGRVVPIIQAGFIEGEVIITQFVLAELQNIADSSDSNKKIRGKRGLDIIEKMRSDNQINLTILNKNVSGIKEVDQKLIMLAKEQKFKLITNDVNLAKIAKLQDVKVLNVNELAYAIKPIVYPGEMLKVIISKEGKEKKQGIAYLDDGTMVVIDDAKTDIGKKMQVEVTSVLQTTSGKMIFGKKI
jgi:uncharacterized protein YacL